MAQNPNDVISGATGGATAGAGMGFMAGGPVGAAVGAGIGGLVGGIGGLFGGGGSVEKGMTLPPALEFRMLNDMYTQFEQMKADYSRIQATATSYQQKFDTLAKGLEANVPPEELRRELARSTAGLAQGLGMGLEDAMKQGFLTDTDLEDINKLKELESAEFRDPQYDQMREQQKQQLLMNLRRQNASPQQISQALQSFDNETNIGAFQVAEQLRASRSALISNRIGVRQGLQQQTFGFAQGALGAQLGALGQYGQTLGAAGQMYGQGFQTFATGLGLQSALRGEQRDAYSAIGQYKFSGAAKNYMKTDPFSSGQFQSYRGWQAAQQGAESTNLSQQWWRGGNRTQDAVSGRQQMAQAAALSEQERKRVLG